MAPEHPGGSAAETRSGKKGKMEKFLVRMEKFIVRMERFHVKMEKTLYVPGRIGAATSRQYLASFRQDTRKVHFVACPALKCDLGEENAAE